ncbi:hypothetical protein [Streptomyces sp. bgisy084]|uniref:hypothetical protein n=1 Tax=Streptomyces sp. bgisy084 TaxID=3413777 RepID=UPI003D71F1A5
MGSSHTYPLTSSDFDSPSMFKHLVEITAGAAEAVGYPPLRHQQDLERMAVSLRTFLYGDADVPHACGPFTQAGSGSRPAAPAYPLAERDSLGMFSDLLQWTVVCLERMGYPDVRDELDIDHLVVSMRTFLYDDSHAPYACGRAPQAGYVSGSSDAAA